MPDWFADVSIVEAVAVALFVVYLVLAIRQQILCWLAAFVASVLSIAVFADTELYMQAGLQVFYAFMAIYGWQQWRSGGNGSTLRVSTRNVTWHLVVIALIFFTSVAAARFLAAIDRPTPFLDSFTAVSAIVTTWMVANKILENWLYWLVIDALSGYLYFSRGLMLYTLLNVIYLILVVFGFRQWFKDWRAHFDSEPSAAI